MSQITTLFAFRIKMLRYFLSFHMFRVDFNQENLKPLASAPRANPTATTAGGGGTTTPSACVVSAPMGVVGANAVAASSGADNNDQRKEVLRISEVESGKRRHFTEGDDDKVGVSLNNKDGGGESGAAESVDVFRVRSSTTTKTKDACSSYEIRRRGSNRDSGIFALDITKTIDPDQEPPSPSPRVGGRDVWVSEAAASSSPIDRVAPTTQLGGRT